MRTNLETPTAAIGTVKDYLVFVAGNVGRPSIESWVLKYGKHYDPTLESKLPKPQPGEAKMCFKNAGQLALLQADRYTYVEGYACGIIPMLHAWCIDPEGRVVDPTWSAKNQGSAGARRRMLARGDDYFGVAFQRQFLLKMIGKTGYWGMLDQWRIGWPVLHMSEDALRTEAFA